MTGVAEFVLAGLPTIDLCRKYIKEGRELWSCFKNAEIEVSERFVRLKINWLRLISQLNFVENVKNVVEEEHREAYEQSLSVLNAKILAVVSILRSLVEVQNIEGGETGTSPLYVVRKGKYAMKKKALDTAIGELEAWLILNDQAFFLFMRVPGPHIDNALKVGSGVAGRSLASLIPSTQLIRSGLEQDFNESSTMVKSEPISLKAGDLSSMRIQKIAFCDNIMTAERTHSDKSVSSYILNQIQCEPASKRYVFRRNARHLVKKLLPNEPFTFGLLQCKGFILDEQSNNQQQVPLTLVFRCPKGLSSVRSLRDMLLHTPNLSTSKRLKIAQDVAKAVGSVHTFGFVHKNIRPESLLVFESSSSGEFSVFLVGFDNFRKDEGWTQRRGDDEPTKNLYRHASRQGFHPAEDYEMQHDIYCLGVCMLELGLWTSFVQYHDESNARSLSIGLPSTLKDAEASKFLFESGKDHLISLARSKLPSCMGDKYTEVVETCLTCLDPNNADFGNMEEFVDEDGIRVGARYIQKVLLRLNLLNM